MPNKAEFIKASADHRWPKQMHLECFEKRFDGVLWVGWKSYMMNKFWSSASCSYCGVKLQCKCSPFRVSEPETGNCKHETN